MEKSCFAWVRERGAAHATKDYSRLERLANQFIRDCKWTLDPKFGPGSNEMYSDAYQDLAIIYSERGDFVAALEASEKGIDIFYENYGCHLQKVIALTFLGRKPQARTACDIAVRLLAYLIEGNERNLERASQPKDKERYSNKLEDLKKVKAFLELLREGDFEVDDSTSDRI
jgi:tetratricopeptide (TPR) repeat protein